MPNKLELTWYGKDTPIRVEPRLLIENASLSNCAACPDTENLLIHGDNLLALKALERKYAGQVKCAYLDPPYNTGSAFEQYDDNLEHSIWLNLMYPRICLLRSLLSNEGSVWISLDDNEAHYMKVLCDEIFGRHNFLADVAWEKSDSPRMDAKLFSTRYDHTLVYAKNVNQVTIHQIELSSVPSHYDKTDESGRKYYLKPLRAMNQNDSREARPNLYYPLAAPDGSSVYPQRPDGSDGTWRWSMQKVESNPHLIEWVQGRKGWSPYYRIYADEHTTRPPETLWRFEDAGSNRVSKAEIKSLFKTEKAFETPKPEKLIQLILNIATDPGDLVLDSFLGSGTTAAVAHKMGRRWIGVEMGEHAYTPCKVRLDKVVVGEDKGGVTKAENWNGGGGYRFFELAPSLINRDEFGEEIINPDYDANMLAAAVALHEGFAYQPDETVFWKQSKANKASFLFVTTRHVNADWLASIHASMNEGEYLSIACRSYDKGLEKAYPNIDIRKIPQMLLERCEFGKSDYNLNIVHPPAYEDEEDT
ncbi:MAG: site-specific DNA-methyltransferase [Oscillospiraceae bacterium]|nr:site-specific DNA-methyltransferase [Oscillospiraceae bacterium]